MTLSQEKRDNVGEYLFNADEMESIEISEKDLHKRKKCEMSTEITEGETLDFVIKREDVGEGISMKVFSENQSIDLISNLGESLESLKKKCVYAEDKRNINSLEKNIEQQIKVEKKVLKTELTEAYETNPDSSKVKNDFSRISLLGHGTRERLSQSEGEIYRDVCIRILNLYTGKYKFKFCIMVS